MKLAEIAQRLQLRRLTPEVPDALTRDVTRGYASDLLSDVLANAPEGAVLVTSQVHLNVIAVCVHAGVAAVIFAAGRRPDEPVRQKAVQERIVLYASTETAFDVAGRLYALGLRGAKR